MLRPTILKGAQPLLRPLVQRRFEHAAAVELTIPPLLKDKWRFIETGVGREGDQFLSAKAVDLAWTQYMKLTLKKLNRLTASREIDPNTGMNSLQAMAIRTARNPIDAPIFNNASMAHNNHFFFDGLSSTPVEMHPILSADLVKSFGSLETLRREFLVTAMAMFGPGFVWLVKTRNSVNAETYRLLPTYLAGTPYPQAHFRHQTVDMNTIGDAPGVDTWMQRSQAAVKAGAEPTADRRRKQPVATAKVMAPPGAAANVLPVLCLNTWEHVWTTDYGVLHGPKAKESKRVYVEKWWDHIDWDVVGDRAGVKARQNLMS